MMNLKFDDIKKLHQKKYRSEFGYFLVEGEHLVLELEKAAQNNPLLQVCELFVTEKFEHWPSRFKKNIITERQMVQLSDTKSPQGIIAVAPLCFAQTTNNSRAVDRAIYLHEVQDPGNLGTILRTLAWFGGFRCLLSAGSVDPYNSKVVRSSLGAIFHVPIELDVTVNDVSQRFNKIACLDMQGSRLSSPGFKDFDCYVFGNEARGVPAEQLQAANAERFTIAGSGVIESLNLATTVSICLYELSH